MVVPMVVPMMVAIVTTVMTETLQAGVGATLTKRSWVYLRYQFVTFNFKYASLMTFTSRSLWP